MRVLTFGGMTLYFPSEIMEVEDDHLKTQFHSQWDIIFSTDNYIFKRLENKVVINLESQFTKLVSCPDFWIIKY